MKKSLDNYLYQISEDATYQTPVYNAIKSLGCSVASFIIHNHPDYIAAEWG